MAKSRTIFSLVVRHCYGLESFRKGKGPGLDDQLVRINVGSVSVNFRTSIRLTFRSLCSAFWVPDILARFVFAIDFSRKSRREAAALKNKRRGLDWEPHQRARRIKAES